MRELPLPQKVGRYEVIRLLGQGAMGRVLLAQDPILGREVAVKMLRPDLDIGLDVREGLLARMRQEAKAAARVSHPNIVTLHDLIDEPEHGVCLVFEYVSGRTLKDRIADGPVPATEMARIAREIGNALSVAHRAGVLHRDIKPENIMLAEYGAKIADFGIARVPDSTLTRAGGLLGTPAYSAPECISSGTFSPLSDQFSLAATLYEAISGLRAFPGDDAIEVAARIGTQDPGPIAQRLGLDPRVDLALGRGLSKEASRRFATCEALGEALAAGLEIGTLHDATRTQVDLPLPAVPPKSRQERWLSVGLGGIALGALAALAATSLMAPRPATPFEIVAAREADAGSDVVPSKVAPPTPRPARTEKPPSSAGFQPVDAGSQQDVWVVDSAVGTAGNVGRDAESDARALHD